jgi:hypothetical protein
VTPEQAVRLLSVEEWPPKLEHWPPRDKSRWHQGMSLVGRIEAVMTLPRPDGSKKRGEPYTALYVRRFSDQRLVMFHGWHTAAEDLDGMHPAPGLLFACVYRGERDNGFEDFKYLVCPYDAPPARQQTRQAGGRPTEAPPSPAPETGEASPSPVSGSNRRPTTIAGARTYVQAQPAPWRERFTQILGDARASGKVGDRLSLEQIQGLIAETHAAMARDEAA